jgi:hypothetical protein
MSQDEETVQRMAQLADKVCRGSADLGSLMLGISACITELKQRGWAEPCPVRDAGRNVELIECGCSMVYPGRCDSDGYWSYDDEWYPSDPMLVRVD